MSETARSITQDSLEQIKVYPPGVALDAADGNRGLRELNDMLDEWSNESLACYANVEQSFTLQIGKNSYTIGAGGDINLTRPLAINTGKGGAYLVDTNSNRYGMNVIEQDQWNQIGQLTKTSDLPDTLFYDPQYPLGIINIFPTPSAAYTVKLDSRLQLTDFATLDAAVNLPPGYKSAIKNNLTVRLWPFYKQGDPPGWLINLAQESLGKVKRTNIRQSPAVYDSAIVSKGTSSYNIYLDTTNRGNS